LSTAIIDTSSLIALALAEQESDIVRGDTHTFWRSHGGIDGAIEAFILYDDLVLDGPSLHRNADRLPQLHGYAKRCRLIGVAEDFEDRVYQSVLNNYVPHVEVSNPAYRDLFHMHTQAWMAAEVGARAYSPSVGWREIEHFLTGQAALVAAGLRKRFGENVPMAGAACALLLRTLYYFQLQQWHSTDLILHPLKGRFLEAPPRYGAHILGMFDDSVRTAFHERKTKWLGRSDLSFEIPALTSFVLNQCRSWKDLLRVVEEVRESKPAVQFRAGLNELLHALARRDNLTVDAILGELERACESWSRSLSESREEKKRLFRVSVPILGVAPTHTATEGDAEQSPARQLLVFIHAVMSES
jgi:hypothetical protein